MARHVEGEELLTAAGRWQTRPLRGGEVAGGGAAEGSARRRASQRRKTRAAAEKSLVLSRTADAGRVEAGGEQKMEREVGGRAGGDVLVSLAARASSSKAGAGARQAPSASLPISSQFSPSAVRNSTFAGHLSVNPPFSLSSLVFPLRHSTEWSPLTLPANEGPPWSWTDDKSLESHA